MRRRRIDPFDPRSMGLSAILHAAIFALGWASTLYAPAQMVFETYEIELVSPPPAVQAAEERQAAEEIVVERPEPEPLPPEPEPEEVVPVEEPEPEPPEPEPEEPAEEMPPEVAEEEVEAASVTEVEEEAEVSGEDLNVRIEGLRRDYPLYYENIIRQIQRCFVSRWREGGRWETTLFFYIDREGYAEEIQFVKRSGNSAFDYTAMGAVECAGRGVFGPLPEELPFDRFPVRFTFRPQNAPIELLPGGRMPENSPRGITYGPERPYEQTDAQQQESR